MLCSADVEQGVADGDGLVVGVNLNNADVLVTSGRGDLKAVGRELSPAARGDRGVVGDADEAGDGRRGIVIPLVGGSRLNGIDHDGGLAGVGFRF